MNNDMNIADKTKLFWPIRKDIIGVWVNEPDGPKFVPPYKCEQASQLMTDEWNAEDLIHGV